MDDIVKSVQRGNQESLNKLITTYTPGLKAMLLSMEDESTAGDIIQETWLYRIAINKAKTHFNRGGPICLDKKIKFIINQLSHVE